MTEKPHDQSDSLGLDSSDDSASADNVLTGRSASSPFDQPTERLTDSNAGRSVPRTDDDLGDPTEQLPTYRPSEPVTAYQDLPTQAISQPTAAVPVADAPATPAVPYSTSKKSRDYDDENTGRGTLDLGLLILRIAVGGIFIFHGLQKLTGWWNGPGLDGMKDAMAQGGWEQPHLTSLMVTVGELAGGVLLVLGLATPLAAGAVLAVIIDAWLVRQAMEPGLQFTAPNGPEYESVLVAASAALILTGPGRIALDGARGWATRPRFGSFLVLLLAIAAATCTWIFLHHGNPFI